MDMALEDLGEIDAIHKNNDSPRPLGLQYGEVGRGRRGAGRKEKSGVMDI